MLHSCLYALWSVFFRKKESRMRHTTQDVAICFCHYIFLNYKTSKSLYSINCSVSLQKTIAIFRVKKTFFGIFLSLFFYTFRHKCDGIMTPLKRAMPLKSGIVFKHREKRFKLDLGLYHAYLINTKHHLNLHLISLDWHFDVPKV